MQMLMMLMLMLNPWMSRDTELGLECSLLQLGCWDCWDAERLSSLLAVHKNRKFKIFRVRSISRFLAPPREA